MGGDVIEEGASVRERQVLITIPDTTVMTVMDNLYQKGWLGRDRRGRAYWYHSLKSREQTVSDALRAVLADAGDPSGALLHFVRHASDEESAAIAQGLRERD